VPLVILEWFIAIVDCLTRPRVHNVLRVTPVPSIDAHHPTDPNLHLSEEAVTGFDLEKWPLLIGAIRLGSKVAPDIQRTRNFDVERARLRPASGTWNRRVGERRSACAAGGTLMSSSTHDDHSASGRDGDTKRFYSRWSQSGH
jgi:hypothetical protein